jgi:hypothetical protein
MFHRGEEPEQENSIAQLSLAAKSLGCPLRSAGTRGTLSAEQTSSQTTSYFPECCHFGANIRFPAELTIGWPV